MLVRIEFCVHVAAASCDRSTSLSSHDRTHFSDTSRVGVFTQFRALASDVDDPHRSYSGTWFQRVGRPYDRAGQRPFLTTGHNFTVRISGWRTPPPKASVIPEDPTAGVVMVATETKPEPS